MLHSTLTKQINYVNEYERNNGPHLPSHGETAITFIYAEGFVGHDGTFVGAERAPAWATGTLSIGGLFGLCAFRDEQAHKQQRGIAFCTLRHGTSARRIENVESWTGIAFDDDNHKNLGRALITRPGGPLRCSFSTASDGKCEDAFSVDAYTKYGKDSGNSIPLGQATDADIQRFLNSRKDGEPYRGVKVVRTASGLPKARHSASGYQIDIRMEPQTRTRTVVPFAQPVQLELLREIIDRGLVKDVCKAIELDIFGVHGHDEKTMNVILSPTCPPAIDASSSMKYVENRICTTRLRPQIVFCARTRRALSRCT